MNMNLMAEKIFVVVEFGVKEKYDRCYSSSRKKLYFFTYTHNVLNKNE